MKLLYRPELTDDQMAILIVGLHHYLDFYATNPVAGTKKNIKEVHEVIQILYKTAPEKEDE